MALRRAARALAADPKSESTATTESARGVLAGSERHQPRTHETSPGRQRRRRTSRCADPSGVTFLAIMLDPGSEDHHSPADERAGRAHDKERDNEGYLAHVRS